MILEVRAVAPFYKNGFLVACERTREAIVIDPGDEVDEILGAVRDHDVQVQHLRIGSLQRTPDIERARLARGRSMAGEPGFPRGRAPPTAPR